VWLPICSPFTVSAVLRMADDDAAYGLRVKLEDLHDGPRTVDFDRGELSHLSASEIRARLLRAGMRIANGGELTIIELLKEAKPAVTLTVFSRTGWHRLGGELMFVTETEVL
jgi:hypothetical protein